MFETRKNNDAQDAVGVHESLANDRLSPLEKTLIEKFTQNIAGKIQYYESLDHSIVSSQLSPTGESQLDPSMTHSIVTENIPDAMKLWHDRLYKEGRYWVADDPVRRQQLEAELYASMDEAIRRGLIGSFYDRVHPSVPSEVTSQTLLAAARFPVKSEQVLQASIDRWFNETLDFFNQTTLEKYRRPPVEIYWTFGSLHNSEQLRTDIYEQKILSLLKRRREATDPRIQADLDQVFAIGHPDTSIEDFRGGRQISRAAVTAAFDKEARKHRLTAKQMGIAGGTAAIAATTIISPAAAATPSSPSHLPNLGVIRPTFSEGFIVPSDVQTAARAQQVINAQAGRPTMINIPSSAFPSSVAAAPAISAEQLQPRVVQIDVASIAAADVSVNVPAHEVKHVTPQATAKLGKSAIEIANIISLGGVEAATTNIVNKETTKLNSLRVENPALAQKLTQDIKSYQELISKLPVGSSTRVHAEGLLARLYAAIENPASLRQIDTDEYNDLANAYGADFAPLFGEVGNDIYAHHNTIQYDKWKGIQEADLKRMLAMLSYVELATTPQNEINGMLAEFAENNTVVEPSPVNPEVVKNGEVTMLDIINRAAQKNKWSSDKKMFYQAAAKLGLSEFMMASIGGNAGVESAGYDMTIEERTTRAQKGFGYFQWTFERRNRLESAARKQGVDLDKHTVENAQFQLGYAINEMKHRDPRANSKYDNEWQLMQAVERTGKIREGVWQFQYNFERPAHEQPQSARIRAGEKVYSQLMGAKKELQEAAKAQPPVVVKPRAAAPRPPAEVKAPENGVRIQSGNPRAQAQLDSIIGKNKNTGAQLWEKEEPMLQKKLENAGVGNGRVSNEHLMVVDSYGHKLHETAGRAFKDMVAAYEKETGRNDMQIQPTEATAYRSFEQQQRVKKQSGRFAAEPGTSNHGWGLAVDLKGLWGPSGFNKAQYKWLIENAHRFGFFHSFAHAKGASTPEAHHWNFLIEDY